MIPELRIEDYDYPLDSERIAKYPLERRDASKLLVYKDGTCEDRHFYDLPHLLPSDTMMVFNDTKVVSARMFFQRPTGAHIEIFCLEPVCPPEYDRNFASEGSCQWKCIVGNVKRWKDDVLRLSNPDNSPVTTALGLTATLVERDGETAVVQFDWASGEPFSSVLEHCGKIPIPPYLDRETEEIDKERYQTLYAKYRGSVAAPTAGLHFTDQVLKEIRERGIDEETVCLHVGAGTFLPVKSSLVSEHNMHSEPFTVTRAFLYKLRDLQRSGRPLTAVGTTSVRTLESLYYAGVKCIELGRPEAIEQWMPYLRDWAYTTDEALGALIGYMDAKEMESLSLGTRIIIVPGFQYRFTDILVTNFHQPQSTLLLLISAFLKGNWRPLYDHALAGGYRFLSYGDSSLLFRA
ncbi:MAG: S-adenosylmethionine:tRNA ribosyltransferase-isomerase [Bacteroidales bacterium]|nr:S-adenosylmethionine:tRNA ribosyltransferase-isomerase [Bacteroidales bacterium]